MKLGRNILWTQSWDNSRSYETSTPQIRLMESLPLWMYRMMDCNRFLELLEILGIEIQPLSLHFEEKHMAG
jgi:hypothetical protein